MRVKIAFQENIIFLRKNNFCIGFCIKKEGRAYVDFLVAPLFRGKNVGNTGKMRCYFYRLR